MADLILNNGRKVMAKSPLDGQTFYNTIQEALEDNPIENIPIESWEPDYNDYPDHLRPQTNRFIGQIMMIQNPPEGDSPCEYWFKDGIADADLVRYNYEWENKIAAETDRAIAAEANLQGQVTSNANAIASEASRATAAEANLQGQVDTANARITNIENLGDYVGAFNTYAALPKNTSGFTQSVTVNDFATIRADETRGGAVTRYVVSGIASNGAITWNYDVTYSTDITGKLDKLLSATGDVDAIVAPGVYTVTSYSNAPPGVGGTRLTLFVYGTTAAGSAGNGGVQICCYYHNSNPYLHYRIRQNGESSFAGSAWRRIATGDEIDSLNAALAGKLGNPNGNNTQVIQGDGSLVAKTDLLAGYLPLAGGTMTGTIGWHDITGGERVLLDAVFGTNDGVSLIARSLGADNGGLVFKFRDDNSPYLDVEIPKGWPEETAGIWQFRLADGNGDANIPNVITAAKHVTRGGTESQYIRGDGTLAEFPTGPNISANANEIIVSNSNGDITSIPVGGNNTLGDTLAQTNYNAAQENNPSPDYVVVERNHPYRTHGYCHVDYLADRLGVNGKMDKPNGTDSEVIQGDGYRISKSSLLAGCLKLSGNTGNPMTGSIWVGDYAIYTHIIKNRSSQNTNGSNSSGILEIQADYSTGSGEGTIQLNAAKVTSRRVATNSATVATYVDVIDNGAWVGALGNSTNGFVVQTSNGFDKKTIGTTAQYLKGDGSLGTRYHGYTHKDNSGPFTLNDKNAFPRWTAVTDGQIFTINSRLWEEGEICDVRFRNNSGSNTATFYIEAINNSGQPGRVTYLSSGIANSPINAKRIYRLVKGSSTFELGAWWDANFA